MGFQLHETVYGHNFFNYQLPELTEALQRVANALEQKNEEVCVRICREDYFEEERRVFCKGKKYIAMPDEQDCYAVYDVEDGKKIFCSKRELDRYLAAKE